MRPEREAPGSTNTDHIRSRTGHLTPITRFAAFLAATLAEKQFTDPLTHQSVDGDAAGPFFNGRIYDFSHYLIGTSITPPTHAWICLGTNDIGSCTPSAAAVWIEKGVTIMVGSILSAGPGVKIALALPTCRGSRPATPTAWRGARSLSSSGRWPNARI